MDLTEFSNTMHNTYKVFLTLVLVALLSVSADAQNRTYSPYSRYGLGETQDGGFGRNAAMGNTGIALSSSYNLNNINPASYYSMDSISFFFEGGVSGFDQKITSNEMTAQFSDMNFSYFAVGFPVSKWGFMSIGIKPESLVGYQFFDDNESLVEINDGNYTKYNASGKGNTTKAYTGIALSPLKNLSFGAHFSYVFGKIDHFSLAQFPNDPVALKLGTSQSIAINDFYMDFGIQYKHQLKERHNIVVGAIYHPKTGMKGKVKSLVAAGNTLENNGMMVIAVDTLQFSETKFKGDALESPEKIGFGLAYNIDDFMTVTADYTLAKWSNSNFPNLSHANGSDKFKIDDEETFAFGLEIIPNYRSANFYPSRIKYRLGTSYKKEYLIAPDGEQLSDFGITFGVGLPLKRSKTSFNLAFEWGQRGTTSNSLVKEDYLRFTMNLTLHEYWFMKRKFD